MKKLKTALAVLLIAAIAIAVWESAWHWLTPERRHERHLRQCVETYAEYKEVLNAVLPRLRDQTAPSDTAQMILDPIAAYVRGDSPDDRLIDIPLANFGDFYRYTYAYGLVWAVDADRVLAQNPGLVIVALENGWYAYARMQAQ